MVVGRQGGRSRRVRGLVSGVPCLGGLRGWDDLEVDCWRFVTVYWVVLRQAMGHGFIEWVLL